jgi:hypothetical protein
MGALAESEITGTEVAQADARQRENVRARGFARGQPIIAAAAIQTVGPR